MDNEFTKLFHEYNSQIDEGMCIDIQEFFRGRDDIKDYIFETDEAEKVLINIKLTKFSKWYAKKLFFEFIRCVGYGGINLYICDNGKQQVRYLYLTAIIPSLYGTKMEIIIE
jgi:hypothetical protein